MKTHIICTFLFSVLLPIQAEPPTKKNEISVESLNTSDVIGKLGIPLGTVVKIEATIVSGDELGWKAYSGLYLLKVTSVKGKKLKEPPIMRFYHAVSADLNLPNSHFSLYKFRHGKKASVLTSAQVKELEKGYVGTNVKLTVYELGAFSGIPDDIPPGMTWQDTGFHFRTWLSVLKSHKK